MFKIAGDEGRVLIPGEVKTFKVTVGQDSQGTYAAFDPGFFFEGSEDIPLTVGTDPDRHSFRQPMMLGSPIKIQMNWTTYGHEEVSLGDPC